MAELRKDGDGRQMTGRNKQRREAYEKRYEIRVGGHLGRMISAAFPEFRVQLRESGDTVLSGVLADQAALYGVLYQLEALGLELIEVRRVP